MDQNRLEHLALEVASLNIRLFEYLNVERFELEIVVLSLKHPYIFDEPF